MPSNKLDSRQIDRSLFKNRPSLRTILIVNERKKLTANYVNAIAGSIFAVGGLVPIFAVLHTSSPPSVPIPGVVCIAIVCWIASASRHYAVRRFLKELVS